MWTIPQWIVKPITLHVLHSHRLNVKSSSCNYVGNFELGSKWEILYKLEKVQARYVWIFPLLFNILIIPWLVLLREKIFYFFNLFSSPAILNLRSLTSFSNICVTSSFPLRCWIERHFGTGILIPLWLNRTEAIGKNF